MTLRPLVSVLAIASLLACASGGSKAPAADPSTTAAANATSAPKRGSSNLITQAEIEATHLETIYDVVERLRPNWFRTRGGRSEFTAASASGMLKAYLNSSPMGDINTLRSIQAASVKQVQFLNAADATTRFGTGHDSGVILVTSK
jgi:hypothetical protein